MNNNAHMPVTPTSVDGTTDKRLSVETARQQIRADCKEIRKELKLQPIISNPKDLIRIKDEGIRLIGANKREWTYYEIGFRFIVDDVIASLKDKIGLTASEAKLLEASMGRVFYNPPSRETLRMINAANAIDEDKERSAQIFGAWKTEVKNFRSMRLLVNLDLPAHGSDIFDNPFLVLGTLNENSKDFGDYAADKNGLMAAIKEDESSARRTFQPFYK